MPKETAANTLHTRNYPSYVPVIIVGAGPTGLTAGNLLGMAGIETLILERNATLSDCPKAISIDDEGLRACQAMGVSHEVIKDVLLDIDAQYVSHGHLLATVSPTGLRNGYPLISTFHQPAFEATLLHSLARFPCVETRFLHTVEAFEQDEERVQLTVRVPDGALIQLQCSYLLACDGGKSPIRHALGIPMLPASFDWRSLLRFKRHSQRDQIQRWLVVDCLHDDTPSTLATFFCDFGRQAVTVPAPHHGRRWEFLLHPQERADEMLQMDTIQQLIQQASSSLPSHQTRHSPHTRAQLIRQTVYTFRNAIAARFSSGRVFLLGDAAHLMPPFGGQGMNSGLRDALNLCWKIQLVEQGVASPRLLESYHQERYPHVARMVLFSSILGKLIMPTSRPLSIARDLFFRGVNTIPAARHILNEASVKPRPRYSRGFLLPDKTRITGDLLPQPYITTTRGERLLLDELLGNDFALLRLCEQEQDAFSIVTGEIWQRLKVRFISILSAKHAQHLTRPPAAKNTVHIIDSSGELTRFLRHHPKRFVLVRPDRYIMGTFTERNVHHFTIILHELILSTY